MKKSNWKLNGHKILVLLIVIGAPLVISGQNMKRQMAKILIAEDSSLLDMYQNEAGVVKLLEIKELDLNGDRVPEYLVSGVMCGNVNCPYFIFFSKSGRLSKLPSELEGVFVRVLKSKSNGWNDLLFASHSSSTQETTMIYRFNGRKYTTR